MSGKFTGNAVLWHNYAAFYAPDLSLHRLYGIK
jgi:hypothetical protein